MAQPPASGKARTKILSISTRSHSRGGDRCHHSDASHANRPGSLTRSIKVRVEVCHEEEVEDKQQEARKRYQIWGQPGREDLWESSKRTQELVKTCNKGHALVPAAAEPWLEPSGRQEALGRDAVSWGRAAPSVISRTTDKQGFPAEGFGEKVVWCRESCCPARGRESSHLHYCVPEGMHDVQRQGVAVHGAVLQKQGKKPKSNS